MTGFPPNVHSNDPQTSRAASWLMLRSGARHTNVSRVVQAVSAHPGMTARGVASASGLELVEARRRLTDAQHLRLIIRGVAKSEPGDRVAQSTWWPA